MLAVKGIFGAKVDIIVILIVEYGIECTNGRYGDGAGGKSYIFIGIVG